MFIPDPDPYFSTIPDPESRGQKASDPGFGFATLLCFCYVRFEKRIKHYKRIVLNSHSVAAGKIPVLQLMPFYISSSLSVLMKVVEEQPKGRLCF